MTDLQTLEERTTIDFAKSLIGLDQIKDLFCYLSREIPSRVSYVVDIQGSFDESISDNDEESGLKKNDEYVKAIRGTILSKEKVGEVTFRLLQNPVPSNHFSGIKFDPIPGYDLEEHRKEEIEFMDTVRGYVEKYFIEPQN